MNEKLESKLRELRKELYDFYRDSTYKHDQHSSALGELLYDFMYNLANGDDAALRVAAIKMATMAHPTLQQTVFRDFVMTFLSVESKKLCDGTFDDRNASTVRSATLMLKAAENICIPLV